MKTFFHKLFFAAVTFSALTMIVASSDQAQAQGGCAVKLEKGERCGKRDLGVGGHKKTYSATKKSYVGAGGHPSKGLNSEGAIQTPTGGWTLGSKCDALNMARIMAWRKANKSYKVKIIRCPNESHAVSEARYQDWLDFL